MRCILVRHAESTANREARLQGRAEYRLSDLGYRQAEALHERFRAQNPAPTHVYTSPLVRARETARIAARSWALPIVPWDDLQEYDVGIFSRLTWDEIRCQFTDAAARFELTRDWDGVPHAEPPAARAERATRVAERLIGTHDDDDTVVLFTHGGILQHILAALLGTRRTWSFAAGSTAIFDLEIDRAAWCHDQAAGANPTSFKLLAFNDTAHLATSAKTRGPDDI